MNLYDKVMSASNVLVLGSCVSYQFLNRLFERKIHRTYLWRIGTVSLMSRAPKRQHDFSDIFLHADELRTLNNDFNKPYDLEREIERADFVIIDFMRDIYDYLEIDSGCFVTAGIEWEKYEVVRERVSVTRRLGFSSSEATQLWVKSAQELASRINSKGVPCLLIENQMAHYGFDQADARIIHPGAQWNMRLKGFLLRQYALIMSAMIKNCVTLRAPSYAVYSSSENEYGLGEGHLGELYFNYLADDFFLKASDLSDSLSAPGDSMRERYRNLMVQRLLDHARFGYPV